MKYLLNDMVLTKREATSIDRQIRSGFKQKTGFAKSAPNGIVHSELFYKVFNISQRQVQRHTTNLIQYIARKDLIGQIIRNKLQELQYRSWTEKPIGVECPLIDKQKHNLLQDVLRTIQKAKVTIIEKSIHPIVIDDWKSGTWIGDLMGTNWMDKYRTQLRKHRIKYIEQCLNTNMNKVLEWPQVNSLNISSANKRKEPKWYQEIQDKLTMAIASGTKYSQNEFNRFTQIRHNIKQQKKPKIWVMKTGKDHMVIGREIKTRENIVSI
jgi:DNA-binding ferritin-like protein (Dps family)